MTYGIFDRFHYGHHQFMRQLKSLSMKLIVGIYDDESVRILEKTDKIQRLEERIANIEEYTNEIFIIMNPDPTNDMKEYLENKLGIEEYTSKMCFITSENNSKFPGKSLIEKRMEIRYVPYNNQINSKKLRSLDDKIGVFNNLLEKVSEILRENGIPFYLDCGTLLGCIREGKLLEHDTDVDITIHLSRWEDLKGIKFEDYDLIVKRVLEGYPDKEDGNMISVKTSKSPIYCDIYANPAFPLIKMQRMNGIEYPIPENAELYIEMLYGPEWKKPSSSHANTRFHRNNGLMNSKYQEYWDICFPKYECKL
jgi:cytidyltransferase-like protein